jgi:pimeloyl-ACP methyl ester carboxylesterase
MESLQLEDGRSLEFCRSGPADASAWLIFHVGTPSAATLFPHVTAVTEARGIGTASYSRAGYGGSTRSEGRTVTQEAVNTAALADHLGASTFFVAGWSGGGPGALACAALLPERVRSCVVFAGNSPSEEVGAEWLQWFPEGHREELLALATGSAEAFRPEYVEAAAALATLTARDLPRAEAPNADRDAFALSPGLAEALADSIRRGAAGVDGWMDDAVASARPWGFRMRDIRVPVTIRHGELDQLCRVEHGRWLAHHVPGARGHILPGHGHTSVTAPFDEVLDELTQTSR